MAIAFDAGAGSFGTSISSLTYAHTCTGSNLILFVAVTYTSLTTGDQVSGVTYVKGATPTAMTLIDKVATYTGNPNGIETYLFYMLNPDTGANNVVVTASVGGGGIWAASGSYTGAQQSGVPDGTNKSGVDGIATTIAVATTTIADNCWVVMSTYAGNGNISAGSGTTIRAVCASPNSSSNARAALSDNGAAKTPAGSVTLTINGDSDRVGAVAASFAPAGGAAATTHNLNLLGVGV